VAVEDSLSEPEKVTSPVKDELGSDLAESQSPMAEPQVEANADISVVEPADSAAPSLAPPVLTELDQVEAVEPPIEIQEDQLDASKAQSPPAPPIIDDQTTNPPADLQPDQPTNYQSLNSPVTDKTTDTTLETTSQSSPPSTSQQSETLVDQNIFYLLGVDEGTSQEKEDFMVELQETVWNDFVKTDLALLITSEEKIRADEILSAEGTAELEKQEQLLEYLDSLIPDLEEIMVEKAMKLKQNLVKERIENMRKALANDQEKISQLDEATQLFSQGRWYSGAVLLNKIG
jgi:hypothetical protein